MINEVKDIAIKLKELLETYCNEGFLTEDGKKIQIEEDFKRMSREDEKRLASFNLLNEYLKPKRTRTDVDSDQSQLKDIKIQLVLPEGYESNNGIREDLESSPEQD